MSIVGSRGHRIRVSRSIEIDVPGVAPPAQVVPDEFVCTEGAKTFSFPAESTYRYGASRVTGLVESVV